VVQVKKAEVREAILRSAFRLFKNKGYSVTTIAQIAAGAKTSESSLYIYFRSKFEILFAICDPWMRDRIEKLEERADREPDRKQRLTLILKVLWQEMPAEDNGFPNNLMQALATTAQREGYQPDLLRWIEGRIEKLVLDCLTKSRRKKLEKGGLAHLFMMAQDGFVLNYYLNRKSVCPDATIGMVRDMLLNGR
jgi:AcrR family transcriptional regulator